MILLCFILFGVTGSAWWWTRRANVNGWIARYLMCLFAHSGVVLTSLLFLSEDDPVYKGMYVAALIPLLSAIGVLAVEWVWKMPNSEKALLISVCILQAGIASWFLMYRASNIWTEGLPWEIVLLIVQCGVLSTFGTMTLVAEKFARPPLKSLLHLLGTMWFMQGMLKSIFAAGFSYNYPVWFTFNKYLDSSLVIVFVVGILLKLKALEFWDLHAARAHK